ncbi:MAG TPA: PQQ-dependent sugar dehydrogenase [Steroidobacteraceae bacterium]|nr:PQQ-dependent sugar dehydrogenase [Steroidobacteraceae bacterium]
MGLASQILVAATASDSKAPPDNFTADEQTPQSVAKPKPAFRGQTEAPARKSATHFSVEAVTTDLASPWSLAFLPDGKMLVTEHRGSMQLVSPNGVHSAVAGVPPVKTVAAQGLHDVVLDPDFAHNRVIYFSYFAPPSGEQAASWPLSSFYDQVFNVSVAERRRMRLGMEQVARARLSEDQTRLEDVAVILQGVERRLVFAPDGSLFATGADRFRFYNGDLSGGRTGYESDLTIRKNFTGRVSRINTDGTIPKDNPFLADPLVPPDVFAFGIRDPEGAAINPATGELWEVEHGPAGGDEVNIIRSGRDYGWPVISYGVQYTTGKPVGSGRTAQQGMEQPVYFWFPDVAPSGMMFYEGDRFPEWKGNLFVGALAGHALMRLVLDGDHVVGEERLLTERNQRIRDVRQGPDGLIYVLTGDGSLLKLVPAH